MSITLDPASVRIEDVGDVYDVAIGYQDPTTGLTRMYGYVISPSGEFLESTDLTDEEHIVQIGSPLSSDRYGRYPRVTQGDWSGGEGQLFYQNPQQYYTSAGMDCTKPGQLQLLPPASTPSGWITPPTLQAYAPADQDGWNWMTGIGAAGPNNINVNGTLYNAFGGGQVYQLLRTPAGVFAVVAGGSTPGIWLVNASSVVAGSTKYTSDIPPNDTYFQCDLAYFSGALYYIATANTIKSKAAADGTAGTLVYTSSSIFEPVITMICSSETGLVFATASATPGSGQAAPQSVLYTFDGSTATRIASIQGIVLYGYTMNGVTYMLVLADQAANAPNCYTLYALSGSTLSVVYDQRYALSDFQPANPTSPTPPYRNGCKITGDGRYLYLGIPGYEGLQFDPVNNAVFRLSPRVAGSGNTLQNQLVNHSVMLNPQGGFFDVVAKHSATGGTTWSQQASAWSPNNWPSVGASGTLQTSYFDFGTPSTVKLFRNVEFDLQQALGVNSSISVQFRVDNQTAWTPLGANQMQTLASNNLLFTLPAGTKGYRIQFLFTFQQNAGATGPQILVRAYSISATLAYVYQLTVACRRQQKVRGNQDDPQKAQGMDLLANIKNAHKLAGGYVTVWMPDPTTDRNASPPGVSQIQCRLEDFEWQVPKGVSPAYSQSSADAARDIEGDVKLTLTEVL